MKQSITYTLFLLLLAGGIWGCTKDKVPTPTPLTKWEKIAGTYKVFDTTGIYLYNMEIKHTMGYNSFGTTMDTLEYINFDYGFHFKTYQGYQPLTWPDTYIRIDAPNPSQDDNGNSWELYGSPTNDFKYNVVRNDTIQLRFKRNNILYYLQDMIPYSDSTYRQVAVKQH